ncbi:MAG TPA: SRPBCC family protein [Acidimicrobiales bacterium]|nr:SRPBCC family protein [Acidimicrobiales bacterium]
MSGSAPSTGPSDVGRWSITATARSSAPVDVVWPLIGEAHRWKEWSFLDRSDLVETGDPTPDGVGAVRRFTRFGIGSQEEVVVWDPPHHLGYTMLKGFPVRHYRADVRCTPDGSGTTIQWSGTFDTLIPGTGRVMVAVLQTVIGRFATGVAGYADQLPLRGS